MTPAPGAGGDAGSNTQSASKPHRKKRSRNRKKKSTASANPKIRYAKRVDEVSAGGLVIDFSGTKGLLIGRFDQKDANRERLLWSLPKGHIEEGETPEEAAIREVAEETGITSEISRELGVIDFWFMAGGKRIHKTVHHYLFKEVSGTLTPQESEVDEARWFPLEEIVNLLAYPDEKKLIARSGELK
ncbi:MAG: NUDIX hydrolase [Candidatus Nanopelagicaceae bacterium]|jgi:ADP-ribose pyrophosphatase YjhB (NUDIX family)